MHDRAVRIVLALYDEEGNADVAQFLAYIEQLEFGVKPEVEPASHRIVGVGVMPLKAASELGRMVIVGGLANGGNVHVLNEKMRLDQHEAADAMVLNAARVNRRDRSAVAVAKQDAALETDRVEYFRQHVDCFAMQIIQRPRQWRRRRAAIACS